MTSDVAFPGRFTEIDELTRPDHSWLTDDDRCYFLGEYTARQGYSYSPTNNLILNFKKEMDRREKPELAVQGAGDSTRGERVPARVGHGPAVVAGVRADPAVKDAHRPTLR